MIEDNAVVHEASYPFRRERVWQALTDPTELAAWLMPSEGFAPVVGQRFTMSCDPIGEIDAEVVEVEPPARLAWRWAGPFGDTIVTFELAAEEGGTRVRLTHRGWDGEHRPFRDLFDSGWDSKLGEGLLGALRGARATHASWMFGD